MRHLYSIPKLISCLVDNRIHHMGIQWDSRPEIFGNNYYYFKLSEIIELFTWHGHWPYRSLNELTHDSSQDWSSLQLMMHWPRSILFSFIHSCKLSSFWGDGFSPQTQIGFGHPLQPFGQLTLHGQSYKLNIYDENFLDILTVNALIKNSSTFNEAVSVGASNSTIHVGQVALAFTFSSGVPISENS